ncbi:homoserine dehydrogenase [Arthrobacter pigmenti]
MQYQEIFAELDVRSVSYALVGAQGQFARSLLAQTRLIPGLRPAVLCDQDPGGLFQLCGELGFEPGTFVITETGAAVDSAAAAGKIALTSSRRLAATAHADVVIEATGVPELGVEIALEAFEAGSHVVMINKESDSVAGVYLAREAASRGLVYTPADGDQPSNLIGLVSWARLLGLEVVAAGKASEYDYVYDPAGESVRYLQETVDAEGFGRHWQLGARVADTLRHRSDILRELPQSTAPDYCEMNIVANSTGLVPSRPQFHYPLARIEELADIYIPVEDGGVLERTGVVDVFNLVRRPDEASFGGGVFIVVRTSDANVWEVLRGKGHLVSSNGRYACIYLPFHLMGVETPLTLFSAALHGRPSGGRNPRQVAVMAGRTERDFKAGEVLAVGGHHHTIDGIEPLLLETNDSTTPVAPYYLMANNELKTDLTAGTLIELDMVAIHDSALKSAWKSGLQEDNKAATNRV